MKIGRTLINLVEELERQMATKVDMVVPTQLLHHSTSQDGHSTLQVETGDGLRQFGITENCRRQLAERLKIPFAYFERMRSEMPELLDRNVNSWLRHAPEQRMVRTLDGRARAFLSDRYRMRDNYDLLVHILPELRKIPDVQFASMELTETRMFIKALSPKVRYELAPGDVVEAGVVVANSETGHGMTAVYPLVHRLKCRNGLIAADAAIKKAHVGRRIEAAFDEVTIFKADTLKADDDAFFLMLRDLVSAAVSESTFVLLAEKMRKTMGIPLLGNPVRAVEKLAVKFVMNENVRVGILRDLIAEGGQTAFDLVQAVTHFAQDPSISYEEATELEMIGGRMLEQSNKEWSELVSAV